jgi:cell division protein ZapA
MSAQAVTVVILDREYAVACTPEEKPGLVAAAAFLDARMREIRNSAKLVGIERIAVMAALNISHESLQMRGELQQSGVDVAEELRKLNHKLDQALAAGAPRA